MGTSRIEQLIDEIEEYIDSCKPKMFSSTDIIVNKEQIDELLRELRTKTPDEIKRYQKIVSNKEAILNDARAKAQTLIDDATAQTTQLINEHEIMQQAYAQANEVVSMASRQAQEILDNAATEANSVRQAAMEYMDNMLVQLENVLIGSTQAACTNYENLISSLNNYREIVEANREEINPTQPDPENISSDGEGTDDIDLI